MQVGPGRAFAGPFATLAGRRGISGPTSQPCVCVCLCVLCVFSTRHPPRSLSDGYRMLDAGCWMLDTTAMRRHATGSDRSFSRRCRCDACRPKRLASRCIPRVRRERVTCAPCWSRADR